MSVQAPSAVIMVRPHRFRPNQQTLADNAFQADTGELDLDRVAASAFDEVSRAADVLKSAGVTVHLFEDDSDDRPDSVFPNNWISTHSGGHVALYPMFTPNRRRERRGDIVEHLKARYRVQDVIDYSGLEYDDVFLEGTGAMVLDHEFRIAYAARSNRADPVALERFCTNFGYEPMLFDAVDAWSWASTPDSSTNSAATPWSSRGATAGCSPSRDGPSKPSPANSARSSNGPPACCRSTCRRSSSPADRCDAC